MQYSVILDLVDEPGFEGYYRIDGAATAASDQAEVRHQAGLTLDELRQL